MMASKGLIPCLLVVLWPLVSSISMHDETHNCSLRDTCSLQQHLSDPRLYTCSCDSTCALYGDCCPGYQAAAGAPEGSMSEVSSCKLLRPVTAKYPVFIIDTCPSDYSNTEVRSLCELRVPKSKKRGTVLFEDNTEQYFPREISEEDGLIPFVPVSPSSQGIMYRNVYCAICHGAQDTMFWNIHIRSPRPISVDVINGPSNLRQLFERAWQHRSVTFSHPSVEPRPCRINVIDTCPPTAPQEQVDLCHGPTSRVFDQGIAYRNVHCAVCNGVNSSDVSCIDPLPYLMSANTFIGRPLPYALLLDINSGTATFYSNKVGYEKVPLSNDSDCAEEVYDPVYGLCARVCSLVDEPGLQVCMNNSSSAHPELHWQLVFKFDEGLGWVTLVGDTLSMCGLVLMLTVYARLAALRNTPGRCLMCLASSLLVAQILFTVAIDRLEPAPFCVAVAMIMHYCFLAQFCWMNAMAFDVWRAFKLETQSFRANARTRSRHFLFYTAYSWTVPAVIVCLSFLLDQFDVAVQPAYGHTFCWLGSRTGLLVLFALPVGLIILINCVLFTLTARNICQVTEGSDILHSRRKEHRRRLILYIKLAVIMGLAWIFGFLATAFDNTVLWYIFTLTNAFQGVFICISFVFTQKVFKAMRGEFQSCSRRRAKRDSPDGTTATRHAMSSKKTSVETVMSSRGRSTTREASSNGRVNRSTLVQ